MSKKTTLVFAISLIIQLALISGFIFFQSHYKDEKLLWTPSESETLTAYEKSKELFPNEKNLHSIKVIVEAVGDNLITR